ncbi:MAG: phage tail protein [Pyrinomonadaceae bacterium]
MGEPFIGEIRMFGGNFPPSGWAFCQGQLMPISENDALFTLIGTTYGGDGQQTFGIPDLQGRAPVHAGQGPGITQNYQLGEKAGVESVTLTTQQIPIHNHAFIASGDLADQITGTNGVLANPVSLSTYFTAAPDSSLNANSVTPVGGSQPHENLQPYLCISFILSLFGVFPTQN